MLGKFWESLGEGLSEHWLQHLLGPAFLFWGGGLLVGIAKIGFYKILNWITSRDIPSQSGLLIMAILVIIFSGQIMKQLRFRILRFLEGYWGWPFGQLAAYGSSIQRRRIESDRHSWDRLMDKQESNNITQAERRALSDIEMRNHYAPVDLENCMPTLLGNTLQAAESAPRHKYGLDAIVCWPRMWLLLPTDVKEDLSTVRQHLDASGELWMWGLLFLGWSLWWPEAAIVSIVWMWISISVANEAARAYADLLEATFDLYRWELYKTTHWPLPEKTGGDEVVIGSQLNQFLWRGYTETPITYQYPKE